MAQMDRSRLNRYDAQSGSNTTFIKIPFFKLGQGTTKVRVLPGQDPGSVDKDFFVLVYLHYKVSPTKPTVPVVCAKTTDPRNVCPICDYIKELNASEDPNDKRQAEEMGQRMKYAMCVLPLEGEDRGKVQVFMSPKKVWQKIISLGGDSDYGDVTHPYEGFDLKLTKSGTGKKNTEYDAVPVRNPSPIASDPEEIKEILSNQFDLWRFKVVPSAEEVIAFMNGDIDRFSTDGFTVKKKEELVAKPPVEEEDREDRNIPAIRARKQPTEPNDEEDEDVMEQEPVSPIRRVPPPSVDVKKRLSNLDNLRSKLNAQ